MPLQKTTQNLQEILQKAIQHEQQGRFDKALTCYQIAQKLQPGNIDIQLHAAIAALQNGDSATAKSHFRNALNINANNITAQAGIASILEREGRYKEAHRQIIPLLELTPHNIPALVTYSKICRHLETYNDATTRLVTALTDNLTNIDGRHNIHFALGDLYDAQGDFDNAFKHYQAGNNMKHTQFDEWEYAKNIKRLTSTFNHGFMTSAPRSKKRNKHLRPIFIIGMPRSGTSLVEQILATHPKVFAGGELTFVGDIVDLLPTTLQTGSGYPECITTITQEVVNSATRSYLKRSTGLISRGNNHLTDKLPSNFLHLGFISLMLPNAFIIHCRRNPLDTCLSCYFNDFSSPHMSFTQQLSKLGTYYRLYENVMQHWSNVLDIRILDFLYEDLVKEPEQQVRKLLEFCELSWHRKCLEFHQTGRKVRTASYSQVRKPLYQSSIARWKPYEKYLEPLKTALARDLSV